MSKKAIKKSERTWSRRFKIERSKRDRQAYSQGTAPELKEARP